MFPMCFLCSSLACLFVIFLSTRDSYILLSDYLRKNLYLAGKYRSWSLLEMFSKPFEPSVIKLYIPSFQISHFDDTYVEATQWPGNTLEWPPAFWQWALFIGAQFHCHKRGWWDSGVFFGLMYLNDRFITEDVL